MKRSIFLGGALLLLAVSYIADAATVWTTCGRGAMTLDQSYFIRVEDWIESMRDINEIYCGTRGSGQILEPGPGEIYYMM